MESGALSGYGVRNMLRDDVFYVRNELNQTVAFTGAPRLDESGAPETEAFLPHAAYAKEALRAILDAHQDPFANVLKDLWLYVYAKPWAVPDTVDKLIADIADKIESRELFVYLD